MPFITISQNIDIFATFIQNVDNIFNQAFPEKICLKKGNFKSRSTNWIHSIEDEDLSTATQSKSCWLLLWSRLYQSIFQKMKTLKTLRQKSMSWCFLLLIRIHLHFVDWICYLVCKHYLTISKFFFSMKCSVMITRSDEGCLLVHLWALIITASPSKSVRWASTTTLFLKIMIVFYHT